MQTGQVQPQAALSRRFWLRPTTRSRPALSNLHVLAGRPFDDPASFRSGQIAGQAEHFNNLAGERMVRMDNPHIPQLCFLFGGILLSVTQYDITILPVTALLKMDNHPVLRLFSPKE